jgi:hypothetical protein
LSRHLGSNAIEDDRGYGHYTIFRPRGRRPAEQRDELASPQGGIASERGDRGTKASRPLRLCLRDLSQLRLTFVLVAFEAAGDGNKIIGPLLKLLILLIFRPPLRFWQAGKAKKVTHPAS